MTHDGIYLKVKTASGGWMVIDLARIVCNGNDKTMSGCSVYNQSNIFLGDVSNPCKIVTYNRKYDRYNAI